MSNIYKPSSNKIEFGELRIGETALKNLKEVCENNWASYGPKCKEFENNWGNLFNYKYNLATSSGTDAVIQSCLSLYGLGIERQSEIITPALSFIATSNAIRAADFKPVFCDINRETLNIDASKIEEKITDKTKAIMVVHTMGKPCEMDEIMEIAKKYNLVVIEDSCEAHGAKYKDTFIGNIGDISCFSFYIAHLICCGEGGMVSTNREDLYETVYSTRSHGRSGLYFDHPLFGLNSKMNDLEASLGLEAVEVFWETFNKRHGTMKFLREQCKPFEGAAFFSEEDEGNVNCPHGFSITLKEPNKLDVLTSHLEKKDIHWKRNFGCIPTQHKAFSYLGHKLGDFPESEYVGDNGIHLGVHQHLTEDDVQYIAKSIKEAFELL
jgi:dTDP-4-amino-4,6-dideoxygalactose transaminase